MIFLILLSKKIKPSRFLVSDREQAAPCPHIGYAPGAKYAKSGERVFCWACMFTKYKTWWTAYWKKEHEKRVFKGGYHLLKMT